MPCGNALLGSVATKVLHLSALPVMLGEVMPPADLIRPSLSNCLPT
ncbi:MAG: hypothetical protein MZW92_51730 [Comamonadaceae bacterium]|nr:hypothetical protein [Comamonadaceae bacterium]